MTMPAWRWGNLELPSDESIAAMRHEMGQWVKAEMEKYGLVSVVGPDGTVYDIEIGVRLVPTEEARSSQEEVSSCSSFQRRST